MDKAIAFIRGQFHNGDAMGVSAFCISYRSQVKKKALYLKDLFFFF